MEAVAAVGVASAAVQFVDFSLKTIGLCKEIRDSTTNSTNINADLAESTRQLATLLRHLEHGSSSGHRQVTRAAQECSRIGSDLQKLLQEIRTLAGKSAIRSAFRAMKERKTIEKLHHRLTDCQRRLLLALTAEMRSSVLEKLQEQGKRTIDIEAMLSKSDKASAISHAETHNRLSALHVDTTESSRRTQDQLARQFEYTRHRDRHEALLESLRFPDMPARQQAIRRPTSGTYEWLFTGRPTNTKHERPEIQESRGKLLQWLQHDELCFWVSGKAGSGKSSLMYFLEGDKRTEDALKTWSGSQKLHIFSFFFWRAGSTLQRSIAGLLRSLLHQLLMAKPAAGEKIMLSGAWQQHSVWTEARLSAAIAEALTAYRNDCVCIFVDGLDEFEGKYVDLVDGILGMRLKTNAKFCLSSRPETVLVNKLEKFPGILLEDLNRADIESHVQAESETHGNILTDEIVTKVALGAEGIFLWAALVTESLISGHEAYDDEATLQQRLQAIPAGLRELFAHMFANIDEVHREQLSKTLCLLKWQSTTPDFSATLSSIAIISCNHSHRSLEHLEQDCNMAKRRAVAQAKGLLAIQEDLVNSNHQEGITEHQTWVLKDIDTGASRMFNTDLRHLTDITLDWTHKSAYDCVLGESAAEKRTSWATVEDEIKLARRVLNANTWLTLHAAARTRSFSPHDYSAGHTDTPLHRGLANIASLVDITSGILFQDACQAYDQVLSAICSLDELHMSEPRLWLRLQEEFWCQTAMNLERYLFMRKDRIRASVWPQFIISSAILSFFDTMGRVIDDASYEALLPLIDYLCDTPMEQRSYHQFSTLQDGIISYRHCTCDNTPPSILSYATTCPGVMLMDTYHSSIKSHERHRTPYEAESRTTHHAIFESRILALLEANGVFWGTSCEKSDEGRVPLRLCVPAAHSNLRRESQLPGTLKLKWPLRIIRLFLPELTQTRLQPELNAYAVLSKIRIDLSPLATGDLMRYLCPQPKYGPCQLLFSGSAAARTHCTTVILNEIWANADDALDGWQQLYLLTCVKKWFAKYWVVEEREEHASVDSPCYT